MGYLPPTDIARLRTLFQGADWSGLNDAARFAKLNAPTAVANPVTSAPQVPKPFYASDILPLLSVASQKALGSNGFDPSIIADIDSGNGLGVQLWAAFLLNVDVINQTEHDAIVARVQQTEDDPAWTATVAGPSPRETLFGADKTWASADGNAVVDFVPLEDVEAAR